MKLNDFIKELQDYANTFDAGDFAVTAFRGLDDNYKCVFEPAELTISMTTKEIHIWPHAKKEE